VTERAMSSMTDRMVASDSHTVPGAHACSFDFV
jgi:hypothetical protein